MIVTPLAVRNTTDRIVSERKSCIDTYNVTLPQTTIHTTTNHVLYTL